MDDILFNDFDVDALLDAQSSNDDGSDLPELERSLDAILNDTEFADILGNSVPVKPGVAAVGPDSPKAADFVADRQVGTGPEDEALDISLDGIGGDVNLSRAENVVSDDDKKYGPTEEHQFRIESVKSSSREIVDKTPPTDVLPSTENALANETALDGSESNGTLKVAANSTNFTEPESNGRATRAAATISQSPQSKPIYSPRPGVAYAAAAAASRHVGPQQSAASRLNKSTYAFTNGISSGTSESDANYLETGPNLERGNSPPLSQTVDAIGHHERSTSPLVGKRTEDHFAPPDATTSANLQKDDSNELEISDVNNALQWNSDAIHATAIADIREDVEILSSPVPQLHDQPDYNSSSDAIDHPPNGPDNGTAQGDPFSVTVSNDESFDRTDKSNDRNLASEREATDQLDLRMIWDHLREPAAEKDREEPDSADVNLSDTWTEGMQEHASGGLEPTTDAHLQRAQSLALRRNSLHRHHGQQGFDEIEQHDLNVNVKTSHVQPVDEKPQLTALQVAEELERNAASSGLDWEEGAVAQPMRLEGIQRGTPAIGLLQFNSGGPLSYALQSSTLRREQGLPQALAVHSNYIAIGLSKGGVLVTASRYSATRSADETDAKPSVLATPGPEKSVSSMCFNQQGDLLLVGYSNGHLVLWDVPKANVIRTLEKEHTVPIVHTLFLGQDVPGARSFKAITSDSKGLTSLHTFTVLPVFRRITVNTTCILDGQRTGVVLSVSPLLPEDGSQISGGSSAAVHGGSSVPMNLSSVMGVVGGATTGDVGRKFLYDGAPSVEESGGGLVVFVTHQVTIVVRLLPSVEVCARLPRPEGIREGAIPYTAWQRTKSKPGVSTGGTSVVTVSLSNSNGESVPSTPQKDTEHNSTEGIRGREDPATEVATVQSSGSGSESCPSLAIAWDKKVLIYQLPKSELKSVAQWEVASPAVGVAWLEEQMLVVATSNDQLCLFTNEGLEIERAALGSEHGGVGAFIYHTHFMNLYGNPEKAYHNALAVRGAALYLLGPSRLWRARLLPWADRIKALENAGDWMGAFHIAMEIYDGRSLGVTGLPRGLEAMREAIMPTLLALLSAYIDEAFAYLSLALGASSSQQMDDAPESLESTVSISGSSVPTSVQELLEAREQYARVGGVAIEFCVHIHKTEVLFGNVFSKFEAVGQRGTFLELLEPYILKDMLSGLAPEVMQALVEHYSSRGWLNRVEQCVLHMDIGSLDFNQVVLVCRDHKLYSALIYLFTKGLDDFKSPLEELLAVAQNSSHLSQAKAFGYKLLVYLRYCFTGFAFPPGNGPLSSSRLPKLRSELLSYLLDPMEQEEGIGVDRVIQSTYPRLLYLLKLDTQATLVVLRAAFPEHGLLSIGKHDHSSIRFTSEQGDESGHPFTQSEGDVVPTQQTVADGLKLAQQTVDAVIHLLQMINDDKKTSNLESLRSVSSNEQWPTKMEVGDMLEFVAYFVAGEYAMVSASIMSQIIDHLTSSSFKEFEKLELSEEKKQMVRKQRETVMVALLNTVSKFTWDTQRTLQLAQNAGYWQVTALIYTQECNYAAALDSYLKDLSQPQRTFTFINVMLSREGGLEGSNLSVFRETVLSLLPELINLSTVSTLLVVLQHYSGETQRVLRELSPHPKLLFSFLKAVMNLRSCGLDKTQSDPDTQHLVLKDGSPLAVHGGEGPDDCLQGYSVELLKCSELELTNEMAETYIELLCRFEPKSVLKFLEGNENYRLEHCLRLCQEYGITDAAAFLLERVGDVASALSLVLADLHNSMQDMDHALGRLVRRSVAEHGQGSAQNQFDESDQVLVVQSVLRSAISLCQRNTFRLELQESESLWFRLLDRFVEPLHTLNKQMAVFSSRKHCSSTREVSNQSDEDQTPSTSSQRLAHWESDFSFKILRKTLVRLIGDIVNGMMGYVPLPVIMNKILKDHRGHEFGDFKGTILDMLSAHGYERAILGTAKRLIEDDAFQKISALKRGFTHALRPSDSVCTICECRLDAPGAATIELKEARSTSDVNKLKSRVNEQTESSSFDVKLIVQIFPCGHATHLSCYNLHYGSWARQSSTGMMCPICSYKSKPVDFLWHSKDPSLFSAAVPEVGGAKTKHHSTVFALNHGSKDNRSSQRFGQSRLQLLNLSEKGPDFYELGMAHKLNLSPSLSLVTGPTRSKATGKSSMAASSRGDNFVSSQYKSKPRS